MNEESVITVEYALVGGPADGAVVDGPMPMDGIRLMAFVKTARNKKNGAFLTALYCGSLTCDLDGMYRADFIGWKDIRHARELAQEATRVLNERDIDCGG